MNNSLINFILYSSHQCDSIIGIQSNQKVVKHISIHYNNENSICKIFSKQGNHFCEREPRVTALLVNSTSQRWAAHLQFCLGLAVTYFTQEHSLLSRVNSNCSRIPNVKKIIQNFFQISVCQTNLLYVVQQLIFGRQLPTISVIVKYFDGK